MAHIESLDSFVTKDLPLKLSTHVTRYSARPAQPGYNLRRRVSLAVGWIGSTRLCASGIVRKIESYEIRLEHESCDHCILKEWSFGTCYRTQKRKTRTSVASPGRKRTYKLGRPARARAAEPLWSFFRHFEDLWLGIRRALSSVWRPAFVKFVKIN